MKIIKIYSDIINKIHKIQWIIESWNVYATFYGFYSQLTFNSTYNVHT